MEQSNERNIGGKTPSFKHPSKLDVNYVKHDSASLESEIEKKSKILPQGFNEKDFIVFRQNKNGRISGGGE
jgi:hypothetical protein